MLFGSRFAARPSFTQNSNSGLYPQNNPASPRRCPTPRVPLAGVNTFIDLLFLTLVLTATISTLLLLVELWETSRR